MNMSYRYIRKETLPEELFIILMKKHRNFITKLNYPTNINTLFDIPKCICTETLSQDKNCSDFSYLSMAAISRCYRCWNNYLIELDDSKSE